MKITKTMREKSRLDSYEVNFATNKGELVLIPKYKIDKSFPKALKPLFIIPKNSKKKSGTQLYII